jgi:hypothetical protein
MLSYQKGLIQPHQVFDDLGAPLDANRSIVDDHAIGRRRETRWGALAVAIAAAASAMVVLVMVASISTFLPSQLSMMTMFGMQEAGGLMGSSHQRRSTKKVYKDMLQLPGYPDLEAQQQYLDDLAKIHWEDVERDIEKVLTDSQDCTFVQRVCSSDSSFPI